MVKKSRRVIIGGNWKLNVTTVNKAVNTANEMSKSIRSNKIEVFIAPSFNSLWNVGKTIYGTKLKLAAQNMHYHESGPFTGEISVDSLVDAGCQYVILGHSERRQFFKETNEIVNLKVLKALECGGLNTVLCIGETAKEREAGKVADINREQLAGSLKEVTAEQMENIIIAYEPVWAIGNKFLNPDVEIKPATEEQATEAHTIARDWISETYGEEIADKVPIIYGGSMKPSNAEELLSSPQIDGGLIGGASLTVKTFKPIIEAAISLLK